MLRSVLLVCLAIPLFADQVKLTNGDRLSGSIQRLADGRLLVDTDMAGPITIPWSNVSSIVSNQPFYIVLKGGEMLSGSLVDSGKGMSIRTSSETRNVTRDEVTVLRSYQEQLAWQVREERRLQPHFLDPWTGFLDTGMSVARGNANVTTISVGANGVRTTQRNKLIMVFNALYARNTSLQPIRTTADLRRGSIRYERNFSAKDFAFVSLDGEYDALQRLDLRAVGGAGYGRHVVRNPRHTFDLFAGSTANREAFSTGLRRLTSEALLSEESSHRLNSVFTFKQKIGIFPNLTEPGRYRLTLDSTAVTTLLRWMSWQISISDRYFSSPVLGTKKNDILVTTGLRFNLLPPKL